MSLLCPFCEVVGGTTYSALADHILSCHTGRDLLFGTDNMAKLKLTARGSVYCWCGACFLHGREPAPAFKDWLKNQHGEWSKWGRHLKKYGGPVAHLLDVKLRPKEPKR